MICGKDNMKLKRSIAMLCLLIGTIGNLHADEPPKYVSATFQEILSRVDYRDKESGAILSVKPKSDAPRLGYGVQFSIRKEEDDDVVSIVMERRLMTHVDVFERYLLRIDDAIREELGKQERFQQLAAERQRQYLEAGKQHIETVTHGKLHAGMSPSQVITLLGKPETTMVEQAVGYCSLMYGAYTLYFHPSGLVDAVIRKEPLNH
jgi:hypothetical protein